ncbi:MAG: hypothetical protein ABI675_03035 [Chitinophagaceae bacterium]
MKREANENINNLEERASRQDSNSYENHPLPYENIIDLEIKLRRLGLNENCVAAIIDEVKIGNPKFEVKVYEKLQAEMIAYVFHCSRHENGLFHLDKIQATLYPPSIVEHPVINGIDIKKLEAVMKSQDWNFERLRWGKEIEDSLRLINLDDDGKGIAMMLWNSIVPRMTAEKPDFIERTEKELGMYTTQGFSSDHNFGQIYSALRERQLINGNLSNLPIRADEHPLAKLEMIDRLANGMNFPLEVRTELTGVSELFLKWDSAALQIKVLDDEGNEYKYDPEKNFVKSTINFDRRVLEIQILKELQQYPITEIQGELSTNNLVQTLLAGQRASIHLERTVIPALNIQQYQIVEYHHPRHHKVLSTHPELEKAVLSLYSNGSKYIDNPEKANSKLMLIGQYYQQKLDFNIIGEPKSTTGYLLAAATGFSDTSYHSFVKGDANKPKKISDELYVDLDPSTRKLNFYDLDDNKKIFDLRFWKDIDKKKEVQIPNDEKALLLKNRVSNGKGMNI